MKIVRVGEHARHERDHANASNTRIAAARLALRGSGGAAVGEDAFPGVEMKTLLVDRENGLVTR